MGPTRLAAAVHGARPASESKSGAVTVRGANPEHAAQDELRQKFQVRVASGARTQVQKQIVLGYVVTFTNQGEL